MNQGLRDAIAAGKSPGDLGFVMPIETASHTACWMSWVFDDHPEIWGDGLQDAQRASVSIARAISQFEPVRMIADPSVADQARKMVPDRVDVVSLAQDDLWFRDTGPLFLRHPNGDVMATNLIFNNWGNKYPLGDGDRDIARALANYLDVPVYDSPLCGEGGGLHVDGRGTVITTETFLLNPNRNPGLTRSAAEELLYHALGARKVIWLPGDENELITDGHIDGILTFTRPGHVLFDVNPDPADPRHYVSKENLRALQGQTDADGRSIEITTLNEAYLYESESDTIATSYVNAYIANGGVIMPRFGTSETDNPAYETFARAFPDRRVVQLDITDIAWAGGGIHCMTQQQPA